MEPGSRVPAAPAVVKDAVFVAAENGSVASVAIESREPFWTLPQGVFGTYDGIVANLAADQTGLYVASTDTKLYALNRSNGKVKWEYFAQTPLRTGPVLTRDAVYIHVPGTGLVALDKTEIPTSQKPSFNRNPLWAIADATQFLSEDDHYAYVRIANQIAAVDKKTGQREFTSKRNDLVAFGTNIKGDGVIFVATKGARIIAVKAVLQPGQVGELVLQPVPEQGLAMAR
jgi:outer membrane protein assembly factor BamB